MFVIDGFLYLYCQEIGSGRGNSEHHSPALEQAGNFSKGGGLFIRISSGRKILTVLWASIAAGWLTLFSIRNMLYPIHS